MRSSHIVACVCCCSCFLLVGCPTDAPDSGGVPRDTGQAVLELAPDGGCTLDEAMFTSIAAAPAAVATVIEVSWELEQAAAVRVLYTDAEGDAHATPAQPMGQAGATLLLGLPQQTDTTLRLVADQQGSQTCSGLLRATTGSLPPGLPILQTSVPLPDEVEPGFLVTVVIPQRAAPWAAIIDDKGRYVWAWSGALGGTRARLSRDRRSMLLLNSYKEGSEYGAGVHRVALDGTMLAFHEAPEAWVDFAELPDGTLAVLVDDVRELSHQGELRTIRGDAVVLVRPDGELVRLWSSFDASWPDLSTHYAFVTTARGQEVEDWSHVNGIGMDRTGDILYLSAGALNAIFAVDAGTGETLWELSARSDDWLIQDPDPLVNAPHSVTPTPNGHLLVFNRMADAGACSEVVEIALDSAAGSARRVWTGQSEDCLHVDFLGNAEPLPGGDTMISWSSMGRLEQLRPDGVTVRQISTQTETFFGFAQPEASLYPATP